MTDPPPLRAVLFDRDDTIVVTDPAVYHEAALWAADTFGLDAAQVSPVLAQVWHEHMPLWRRLRTLADEDAFWGRYGQTLTRRLGLPSAAAAEWMDAFPYERYLKPVAGAREVLSVLKNRGLKVGVLSNTLPSIDRTLRAVGLADLVDVAVASCALGIHKPEAGAFLYTAERLEVAPAGVLFIDDKIENVEAAQALGMHARLIDLRGEQPDAIHDLAEVLDIVDAISGTAQHLRVAR